MNTIQSGKNTGVIITAPRDTDLHVGAIAPTIVNTLADWRQYECDGEWQKDMTIDWDSEACMSFTAVNVIATYLNWLIKTNQISSPQLAFLQNNGYIGSDGKVALSPRFTATKDGTTVNGNDFQNVWDSIGTDGVVPDSVWPMPVTEMNADPANAWTLYYATPTAEVVALGQQFLTFFEIQWEWLISNGEGATQEQFAEWLQVAPIHVAIAVCTGWNTDVPIQGCGTGAQHGVQLSYVDVGSSDYILDHYVIFDKQLSSDYSLSYAVRPVIIQIPQAVQVTPDVSETVNNAIPQIQQAISHLLTVPTPQKTAIEFILNQLLNDLGKLVGL